jgi:hypothetical protein
LLSSAALAQNGDSTDIAAQTGTASAQASKPAQATTSTPIDRRAYGVLPNYRTANFDDPFIPLSTKRKFTIAQRDSFDYPIFFLGGVFAGIGQLDNAHPSYGQGMEGFAKRYAASFADQAIGNYMTEGVMPALFHQDPRYYRRGSQYGGVGKRIWWAVSRDFVARNDNGKWTYNYSELFGNVAASGVANIYYPGERTWGENGERVATQFATDALSQVLKEFWPDIKQKYFSHHKKLN